MENAHDQIERLVGVVKDMKASGSSLEEILRFLRDDGCSPGITHLLLCRALSMTINESKRIIYESDTWADRLDAHKRFHAALEDLLDDIRDDATDN